MINLIKTISRMLPRVSEEGSDLESVLESAISDRIICSAEGTHGAVQVLVVVRQLLRAARCLDERELTAGRWRFVSFPAFLFARSMLESLASDCPTVLDDGFWEAAPMRIRRQRELIRRFEGPRLTASCIAQPIRRVWVSWAPIAIDGKFLLVRRDEGQPLLPGSKGEFVLPGGRATPGDLSAVSLEERLQFFDPYFPIGDLPDIDSTLERTLRRELSEELDLDQECLANVVPVGGRVVYTALEGLNSAHSVTEYFIQAFAVQVHGAGRAQLLKRLASAREHFAWFSPMELAFQKNRDGQRSFLDALLSLPDAQRECIINPQTCELKLGASTVGIADELKVDVPISSGQAMTIGKKGRERHVVHGMDEDECALLGFVAAVRRGSEVSDLAPGVTIVPVLGWILIDDYGLFQRLRSLNVKLTSALGVPITGNSIHWSPFDIEGTAVRLNVAQPEDAFFAPEAFSLTIRDEVPGKSFRIRLERRAISCALGTANFHAGEEIVPFKLGTTLSELAKGKPLYAENNLETWKRDQREIRIKDTVGLKLLVREIDGKPSLCVRDARVLE